MSAEQLLGELEQERGTVIADLEAGIGTALRLQPDQVDVIIAVVEPTVKSLQVAGKICAVARRREARVIVAANRVTSQEDLDFIRDQLQPDELVVIPYDDSVAEADRHGHAPLDLDAGSPAMKAMGSLVEMLAKTA